MAIPPPNGHFFCNFGQPFPNQGGHAEKKSQLGSCLHQRATLYRALHDGRQVFGAGGCLPIWSRFRRVCVRVRLISFTHACINETELHFNLVQIRPTGSQAIFHCRASFCHQTRAFKIKASYTRASDGKKQATNKDKTASSRSSATTERSSSSPWWPWRRGRRRAWSRPS